MKSRSIAGVGIVADADAEAVGAEDGAAEAGAAPEDEPTEAAEAAPINAGVAGGNVATVESDTGGAVATGAAIEIEDPLNVGLDPVEATALVTGETAEGSALAPGEDTVVGVGAVVGE
jgi:hypothetical protein